MTRAENPENGLLVAVKDAKRVRVVDVEPCPRRTSPPITATIDALVRVTFVDSLENLGGNVSRLGRAVFFRDLV